MVTNFESKTQPLTEKEKLLVQTLINAIKNQARCADHWLSSKNLINQVEQEYNKITGETVWIKDSVTLRKLVNYVVTNQILPIASSYCGYWLCSESEFDDQIKSLRERAGALITRANAMAEMKYGNYKANENFKSDEF